jgi:NitT/TauT family transport system permease protein
MSIDLSVAQVGSQFGASAPSQVHRAETSALVRKSLPQRLGLKALNVLPGILLLAAVFVAWEIIVRSMHVKTIYVPAPSKIFSEIFHNKLFYWNHARATMSEAGWGFVWGASIALILAVLMAEFRMVERAMMPLCVIIKVTPSIALAPLFVIMWGFDSGPKIVVSALTIFYATMVNSMTGFKDVDRDSLELLHSVDASRWEIFYRLRLRSATPHLFAAAKIVGPLAVLGAVFCEMTNSRRGLGNLILTASHNIRMVRLWAAIFCLMFIGIVIVMLVTLLERRLLRWHASQFHL